MDSFMRELNGEADLAEKLAEEVVLRIAMAQVLAKPLGEDHAGFAAALAAAMHH